MEQTAQRPIYAETTSLDVGRGGVRVRIDGLPARMSAQDGEPMLPAQLAFEVSEAIERILAAVERHTRGESEAGW